MITKAFCLLLLMMMASSVSSKMIKNGLGICLSYEDSFTKTGQLGMNVTTETCNLEDSRQTNWNVIVVNHFYNYKSTMVMTISFAQLFKVQLTNCALFTIKDLLRIRRLC